MKNELSSGAVICRPNGKNWDVLLIRDMNGSVTFPKGVMEQGEERRETAVREAKEETGISHLVYIADLPDVSYVYTRKPVVINKLVHYTLFIYANQDMLHPQKEEGITEVLWLPLTKALKSIGYPLSNVPVLREAEQMLQTYHDH